VDLQIAVADWPEERAWGWCSEYAGLGFSVLVLGKYHFQFEAPLDRALRSPWRALFAWAFQSRR